MKSRLCLYCKWLVGAVLISGLAFLVWFAWLWFTASKGNLEDVFAQIRVGMGQEEVLTILQKSCYGCFSTGTTSKGEWFGKCTLDANKLPPARDIESCEIEVETDDR